jgi:hypothetical protein
MPSPVQKEIIGDVRYALTVQLKQQYPEMNGARGFLQTTEAYFIRTMFSVDPKEHLADYYIAPGDGGGPIVVEVGDANDETWQEVLSLDRQPVRVLHIGFDRVMNLLHPRDTQFERDLMQVLESGLKVP